VWGSPDDDTTWAELDALLGTRWPHPHGGMLRVDAVIVDSGDRTDTVYAYCFPRLGRRIWAGKGVAGSRPPCAVSKSKAKGGRLFLVGVDTIKAQLMDRLARGRSLRFSRILEPVYYEQLASERKVVRYVRGQPVRRFERKPGARAETLDCLVYAFAARHMLSIPLETRAAELARATAPPATAARVESPWVRAW
jgi:phage terminase large subunit GpA-like protein